ncbi:Long-chain-fatty-acid--CoA ligase FadD13 [BD1-7 clade bacterium]|uniref:Long-chain-fatty-acid--CoA ligase FadD13 n=1 Tax=BD1-7 clade bacterium TaxID=2029982 RepID=A0A5S9QMJ2_9GAMM|nr:Long-chain-fatty-acid--CoA ligase FadD13 [BD1-7 clade bacterium]
MSEIRTKIDESAKQLTGEGSPWETTRDSIDGIEYTLYKNAPQSLKELIDAGRAHGDNEFLIYEGERLTFNQFFAKVDALSYQLVNEFGLKTGDHVAIAMRNYPEWMISFAAVALAGGIVVPINSWGQRAELEYALTDSDSKIAFFDQQRFDFIADDLESLGVTAIVARPSKDNANAQNIESVISAAGDNTLAEHKTLAGEDSAMIMYTSGTTGNPKGALSSHRNVGQAIFNFEMMAICAAMSDPEPIGKMLERGHPPKVLLSVPLFHVSGCHSVFLLSLRAGRPIVIMHKWDKIQALEYIENERVTMISAVPTMLMDMLDADEWDNYDTSSMFGFGAGGSAQPPRLSSKIYEKLPDSFPGTGYGMTESNATGFAATGAAYKYQPKSTGVVTPIVDIKIIDDNGNEVAQGEAGQILIKSPTNVKGYWKKPDATAETLIEGWLYTGDVGYMNDEGFLFITDRIKDMVIRGGENIYSAEVESAILTHEGIAEAAVFGVPDEHLGEELAAAVVLRDESLNVDAIQTHVASQLAKFKVPTKVFIQSEELPKNATRKILKKPLKEKYANS